MIGSDQSDRDNVFGIRHDTGAGHSHQWIEVSSRQRIRNVAKIVREERVNEGKVSPQRGFK